MKCLYRLLALQILGILFAVICYPNLMYANANWQRHIHPYTGVVMEVPEQWRVSLSNDIKMVLEKSAGYRVTIMCDQSKTPIRTFDECPEAILSSIAARQKALLLSEFDESIVTESKIINYKNNKAIYTVLSFMHNKEKHVAVSIFFSKDYKLHHIYAHCPLNPDDLAEIEEIIDKVDFVE